MGSFANSMHIRCDDANKVVDLINTVMLARGYAVTDQQLDDAAMWGFTSALRGVQVAASHNGWVAVLDSDLMGSVSLASDLAKRLETSTIQFMVNDSDSWHYELFCKGSQIDQFDSSGDQSEFEDDDSALEMTPEISELLSGGGLAAMQEQVASQMSELQDKLESNMPEDIRDIHQRMQAGNVSSDEMQFYREWVVAKSQSFLGGLNEMMAGILPSFAEPSLSEIDANAHIEKLRPLLPPNALDDCVAEVLGKRAVFAEQTLGQFMSILGIQSFYSNLSYRYLNDFTEADLSREDIQLVANLRFKSDSSAR